MLDDLLQNYFPKQEKDLKIVLALPEFERFLRKNLLGNGRHSIKIKFEGRVVAKSVEFEHEETRDRVRLDLIDQIYLTIHGKTQRELNFEDSK